MPNRILSNLQGIDRFQSGVGDNFDLLVMVKEDPRGGWFPNVHTGFYYLGTEEGYQFAVRGTDSFSQATTGQIFTRTISGLEQDPTEFGPVILRRSGTVRPLQRVCSPLRAFRSLSFSGSDPRSASVPNGGLLVSLVSHPVTGVLLSVPTTGDIISNEDYTYDRVNGVIYIRDDNPPSLWVTYLVGETDPDLLKQEEVHRVDADGKVRVMYSNVFWASGSVLNPLIRKPTPIGQVIGTATQATTGNTITFSSTGSILSGDIVAVEYYVRDSFTAVPSGTGFFIQYFLGTGGSFTLEYEKGNTWYDISQLASGAVNYTQLNPMLEPRESGFLYLTDTTEPWPSPSNLRVSVSNYNPLYNPSGSAPVIISVKLFDAEGEPLPQRHIQISTSGASGSLRLSRPVSGSTSSASGVTNGLGQVLYAWTMMGTGNVTVTATASGSSVSGTYVIPIKPFTYYTSASRQREGKLLLHMEEAPFRDDLFRVNAYYCYRDGCAFAPSGSTDDYTTSVVFNAESSQFFTLDGLPKEKPLTVTTNADGIAAILVDPVPGDVIRAEVQTPTSGRKRVAQPIIIPKTEVVV